MARRKRIQGVFSRRSRRSRYMRSPSLRRETGALEKRRRDKRLKRDGNARNFPRRGARTRDALRPRQNAKRSRCAARGSSSVLSQSPASARNSNTLSPGRGSRRSKANVQRGTRGRRKNTLPTPARRRQGVAVFPPARPVFRPDVGDAARRHGVAVSRAECAPASKSVPRPFASIDIHDAKPSPGARFPSARGLRGRGRSFSSIKVKPLRLFLPKLFSAER